MADVEVTAAPVPRLALSAAELAAALSVSPRTLRAWRAAGQIPPPSIEIGAIRRWAVVSIQRWLDESNKRGGPPRG
ncbi:MAG: helix-turn-helix domain-containing protein [Planctomycetes bacterium]|nr:helix-turn-helix domain-containing protein [Planctomycetota bacterium]